MNWMESTLIWICNLSLCFLENCLITSAAISTPASLCRSLFLTFTKGFKMYLVPYSEVLYSEIRGYYIRWYSSRVVWHIAHIGFSTSLYISILFCIDSSQPLPRSQYSSQIFPFQKLNIKYFLLFRCILPMRV